MSRTASHLKLIVERPPEPKDLIAKIVREEVNKLLREKWVVLSAEKKLQQEKSS